MNEEFIRINIAFMPPAEIADAVVKLSREIGEKEDAYFVIDRQNFHPHITIYGFEFPARNLEKILAEIKTLSKELAGAKFVFKRVATEEGYIGIECEYTEEIRRVHETIIASLNPWREGHIRDKDRDAGSFAEGRNIHKYGHPYVMDLYHPHVTVIRLKDERVAEKVVGEIEWANKEFGLDRIGAYKMGSNGTCVELIREFKLG